jgi:DNA-binding NtrC family response regulator
VNQKILFVDDEPAALGLYTQMLEGEFDILTAVGGEDGIAMLRNFGPFAIVVSDMQMPGMNGAQFLNRVRQLAPNSIRLLLSGNVDLRGAVTAVNEGGIFRLLMKPCEESILVEAITAALACYHQRKEARVRLELPLHFYRPRAGQELQSAHTVDISSSGARIAGLEVALHERGVLGPGQAHDLHHRTRGPVSASHALARAGPAGKIVRIAALTSALERRRRGFVRTT